MKRGNHMTKADGRRFIYHEPINLDGNRAPMFPDAYKCPCGATLRTDLDKYLHTNGRQCLYNHGQKPRTDRTQQFSLPIERRK